jgi:hypothetical protein
MRTTVEQGGGCCAQSIRKDSDEVLVEKVVNECEGGTRDGGLVELRNRVRCQAELPEVSVSEWL